MAYESSRTDKSQNGRGIKKPYCFSVVSGLGIQVNGKDASSRIIEENKEILKKYKKM
ncbi:MAG TPA: hypothetical protein V6D19_25740 [Stenomitos sp.]